jgi:hypothetical protein
MGDGGLVMDKQTMRGTIERGSLHESGVPPMQQKMITVLALDDRFSGALAYALQSALFDPATIRVVRVTRPGRRDVDLASPLPVSTITAEGIPALVRQCARQDTLVVETYGTGAAFETAVLEDLQRHAPCLVVEVDDGGLVIGASGPEGWSYSPSGNDHGSTADVVGGEPSVRLRRLVE